jgi:hypothetical protein
MAGSIGRSISIGLSANTKNFAKSLRSAEKNLERFKNGVKVLGTAVAASFAAMGAAAVLFGKSAVTAALEDQKSQMMLARTIKNNAKARKDLNKAAEKTIDTLMNEFNVADDKLRPAMGKLVVATKSVSKSQHLMRLALDISAGTGKSLDTVVGALSKAYLGNKTALGKLGIGIDKAKLKTMSFDDITKRAERTFKGSASDAANSYAGAVEGLKIAWSEFQESVGYKILPKLRDMLTYIKTDLMPWLGQVRDGFNGTQNETISPKLRAVGKAMGFEPGKSKAYSLGEALKRAADSFTALFTALSDPNGETGASTLDTLATSLTSIANAMTAVAEAYGKLDKFSKSGFYQGLLDMVFGNKEKGFGPLHIPNSVLGKATGGPVQRNTPYLVGEQGPELMVPSGSGAIRTARQTAGLMGGSTVININGVLDADSARRSIEQVLQNSGKRLGAINLTGSAL